MKNHGNVNGRKFPEVYFWDFVSMCVDNFSKKKKKKFNN